MDRGESEELLEREENLELQDYQDLKGFPELQVQTDQRAVLDPREHSEIWVLQGFRECQENGASQDPRDLKENGEL